MSPLPNHKENLSRLNRIAGQVEGIKKMIEQERDCLALVTQLRAVQSALKAVESNVLHKHLRQCVADAFVCEKDRDQKIKELQFLFDRTA